MAQIIKKIVRSEYPPIDTGVLWVDTTDDSLKSFTSNGWTQISAKLNYKAGDGISIDKDGTINCIYELFIVVENLPTSDIKENKIYLIEEPSESGNIYNEYIYVNNEWKKIGVFEPSINLDIFKNAGYLYAGVATIDTNPGTPDAKVFYIANGKGTYEKFGGLEVTEDDVVVLYWDTAWHKVATGIASQAKLSELDKKSKEFQSSIQDLNGEELSLCDANGNVIATFNKEGLFATSLAYKGEGGEHIDVNTIIKWIIDNLSKGTGDIIEDMYSDKFYITDAAGNVIASVTKDGIKSPNLPENIHDYLWNEEEFFIVGDSLSASKGDTGWIKVFKELMGATFDGERNSQHISVGGTTTVQGDALAGQMRLRLLVKELTEDGITPKHIIYENVNDVTQARETASISTKDDEPFMMSGNFIEDVDVPTQTDEEAAKSYFDTNITSLLSGKTPHHGDVYMMPYYSTGVTLTITGSPTSDGVFSIGQRRTSTPRTFTVKAGDSIQSIIDKIIENDFWAFSDLQVGSNAVSFVATNAAVAREVKEHDADWILQASFSGTGLTLTKVKDNNARAALPLGFYSHNMSEWNDATKWIKLIDLPYGAVLKGVIEYITSTYPECQLIMMIAPAFAFTYPTQIIDGKEVATGYPYEYSDGSPDQNRYNTQLQAYISKYTELWKQISEMYGVKYADICSVWGVNCTNYSHFYQSGNIHPLAEGGKAIGEAMFNILK